MSVTLGAEIAIVGTGVAGVLLYSNVRVLDAGFCTLLSTESLATFAATLTVTVPSVVGVIAAL